MPTRRNDPAVLIRVGEALRRAREARGWTQAEASERMEIEPATLSRYEAGARGLSLTMLAHVAEVLGTTPASLVPDGEPEEAAVRPEIARVVHVLGGLDEHDLAVAVRVVEAIGKSEVKAGSRSRSSRARTPRR